MKQQIPTVALIEVMPSGYALRIHLRPTAQHSARVLYLHGTLINFLRGAHAAATPRILAGAPIVYLDADRALSAMFQRCMPFANADIPAGMIKYRGRHISYHSEPEIAVGRFDMVAPDVYAQMAHMAGIKVTELHRPVPPPPPPPPPVQCALFA